MPGRQLSQLLVSLGPDLYNKTNRNIYMDKTPLNATSHRGGVCSP